MGVLGVRSFQILSMDALNDLQMIYHVKNGHDYQDVHLTIYHVTDDPDAHFSHFLLKDVPDAQMNSPLLGVLTFYPILNSQILIRI